MTFNCLLPLNETLFIFSKLRLVTRNEILVPNLAYLKSKILFKLNLFMISYKSLFTWKYTYVKIYENTYVSIHTSSSTISFRYLFPSHSLNLLSSNYFLIIGPRILNIVRKVRRVYTVHIWMHTYINTVQ